MTDRLAELGSLQYAVENLSTAGTNPNRLGLAGYIHAAYIEYQTWAAANPGVNPNRLSARGRIYGYFYDNASWSPSSLFANSEVGAWYDPSDLTTMFQDRAGTTPVTADGQTVGKILDKSGSGNHAVAPSDAARPLYKTDGTYHWLQFDGVDDSLSTPIFNAITPVTVFFGGKASTNFAYELSTTARSDSRVYTNVDGTGFTTVIGSTGWSSLLVYKNTVNFTDDYVWTAYGPSVYAIRLNGEEKATTTGTGWPTQAFTKLSIGCSTDTANFSNLQLRSLIVRGALSTTQEITDTETWVNSKTGAWA